MLTYLFRSAAILLCFCAISFLIASEVTTAKFAFASCNNPKRKHNPWPAVLAWQPQHWVWTGDAVYHDSGNPEVMRQHYGLLRAKPDYQQLQQQAAITGVWDDHDYGKNDAGGEFPAKNVSQAEFLNFLGVAEDSPRRQQNGLYHAFDVGRAPQQVRVILLDTRFFREKPGENTDPLGGSQWQWLEQQLSNSPAQVHILVSSIQIIPAEHRYEGWIRFPQARQKLFTLLTQINPSGLLLISGDRHIGEISRMNRDDKPPLWEMTASGLTEAWRSWPGEPNQHRVGEAMTGRHFGGVSINWPQQTLTLEFVSTDDVIPPAPTVLRLPSMLPVQ